MKSATAAHRSAARLHALSIHRVGTSVVAALLGMLCVAARAATPDQVRTMIACSAAEARSPEVARLRALGFIGGNPSPAQMSDSAHASAADAEMVMSYLQHAEACTAPLHLQPDPILQRRRDLLLAFAGGVNTYGETATRMAELEKQLEEQFKAAVMR
jgi:hypothetical protein